MERVSPSSPLVSEDDERSDSFNGPNFESSLRTCHIEEDVSVNELGENVATFLQIEENQKLGSNSTSYQLSGSIGECSYPESTLECSDQCTSKCATFPFSGDKALVNPPTEEDQVDTATANKKNSDVCVDQESPRSIPLPSPLKVVSAMKGSREKQGKPMMKLTVTWAPDVYDPIPAPPMLVRIRRPRHKSESSNKKNGKNKQKIKPTSKGSSSRDKKKATRKYVGSSSKCYSMLDEGNRVVAPCGNLGAFDVGNPSLYCGSSFLEKSVTKLHFPVAEAS